MENNTEEFLRKGDNYLAENLSLMLETALKATAAVNLSKDTLSAAEDCIRSLLKSMAILGYDEVIDNKEHEK
jgi:hypothetical protein|tara:strand:- start:2908 stop:3123 length:216 start_codon:yes stop_codon:yes gene_type:complete